MGSHRFRSRQGEKLSAFVRRWRCPILPGMIFGCKKLSSPVPRNLLFVRCLLVLSEALKGLIKTKTRNLNSVHLYTRKRKSAMKRSKMKTKYENCFRDKHKLRVPEDVSACSQPRESPFRSHRSRASFPFVFFSIFKIPVRGFLFIVPEMDHCHLLPSPPCRCLQTIPSVLTTSKSLQDSPSTHIKNSSTPKYAVPCCAPVGRVESLVLEGENRAKEERKNGEFCTKKFLPLVPFRNVIEKSLFYVFEQSCLWVVWMTLLNGELTSIKLVLNIKF